MTGAVPAKDDLYPGSFRALVERFERKQRAMKGASDILPPLDADLSALWHQTVPAPAVSFQSARKDTAARKMLELQEQFEGQPEIFLLHAMLISILRRRDPPPQALPLFFRIWQEEGTELANALPVRWLISSATTFAEIGQNSAQRACGMGLSVLFDMMKLHDSERRLSGQQPDAPFTKRRAAKRSSLPFNLTGYSFKNGDLDMNLLARLWVFGESDATIRPLAQRMLSLVMQDRKSIFARTQALKQLYRGDDDG